MSELKWEIIGTCEDDESAPAKMRYRAALQLWPTDLVFIGPARDTTEEVDDDSMKLAQALKNGPTPGFATVERDPESWAFNPPDRV